MTGLIYYGMKTFFVPVTIVLNQMFEESGYFWIVLIYFANYGL